MRTILKAGNFFEDPEGNSFAVMCPNGHNSDRGRGIFAYLCVCDLEGSVPYITKACGMFELRKLFRIEVIWSPHLDGRSQHAGLGKSIQGHTSWCWG